jgi:TolB-like protein
MLSMTLVMLLSQTPKLAAPAWTAVDVPSEKAQFFALHLSSALRTRGLSVITSQDIATLLGVERQKLLLGCGEDSSTCMVELGSALGAQLVLTGSLAKLETSYQVNLRVLQSADGKVVAQETVRAQTQEALLSALDDAAFSISRQLEPKAPPPTARSLSWIPFVVAGLAAVASGVGFGLAWSTSDELERRLMPGVTLSELTPVVRRGQTLETTGWASMGVAVAAGTTGILMFLLGSSSHPTVSITPIHAGAVAGVGGVF